MELCPRLLRAGTVSFCSEPKRYLKNMTAENLFKYLPEQYVNSVLDGEVLFRNLVYFKRIENDPRRDLSEGTHIDSPDNDIKITKIETGQHTKGRYAFHNTLANPERIFCFCTSTLFRPEMAKFGDACIEICDREEFGRRLERALKRRNRLSRLDSPFLLADTVKYYSVNQAAPSQIDIKNPRHLPFIKRHQYSDEKEFRFVFARRGSFVLKEMIVNQNYKESEEVKNKIERQIIVKIGSIRDIARFVES